MNAAAISPVLIRAGVELVGSTGAEQAKATVLGGLTAIDGRWPRRRFTNISRSATSVPTRGGWAGVADHSRPGQDLE